MISSGETDASLDIDDLFGAPASQPTQVEKRDLVKDEPVSPEKVKREADVKPKIEDDLTRPRAKPKPGRLISNENPLEDYERLVQGEGDMFKKAVSAPYLVAGSRMSC